MEVPFTDLQVGRYYKLKEPFTLTAELQGNGTLQEDIDLLANGYYKLQSFDEDAEFALPGGMTVYVPPIPESNQRENTRDYIFLTEAALPDEGDTLFLEVVDEQPNIRTPVSETTNSRNNLFGNNQSAGNRKRRQSKKRRTVKRKKTKSRKTKSKSRRV
jgi:hypothetical protein